jgi:hypothetical protein
MCQESQHVHPDGCVPSSDTHRDMELDGSLFVPNSFPYRLSTAWTSIFIVLGNLECGVCCPDVCP